MTANVARGAGWEGLGEGGPGFSGRALESISPLPISQGTCCAASSTDDVYADARASMTGVEAFMKDLFAGLSRQPKGGAAVPAAEKVDLRMWESTLFTFLCFRI